MGQHAWLHTHTTKRGGSTSQRPASTSVLSNRAGFILPPYPSIYNQLPCPRTRAPSRLPPPSTASASQRCGSAAVIAARPVAYDRTCRHAVQAPLPPASQPRTFACTLLPTSCSRPRAPAPPGSASCSPARHSPRSKPQAHTPQPDWVRFSLGWYLQPPRPDRAPNHALCCRRESAITLFVTTSTLRQAHMKAVGCLCQGTCKRKHAAAFVSPSEPPTRIPCVLHTELCSQHSG